MIARWGNSRRPSWTRRMQSRLTPSTTPSLRLNCPSTGSTFCSSRAETKYQEIIACSLLDDLKAVPTWFFYNPADGSKPRFMHTLNGSGLAIRRTLAAILENYQQPDGSVAIPKALVPYLNGVTELK